MKNGIGFSSTLRGCDLLHPCSQHPCLVRSLLAVRSGCQDGMHAFQLLLLQPHLQYMAASWDLPHVSAAFRGVSCKSGVSVCALVVALSLCQQAVVVSLLGLASPVTLAIPEQTYARAKQQAAALVANAPVYCW